MKDIYFNKWESSQAYSLIKTNPMEAKARYEKYLEKYPRDYYSYPYYIRTLIVLEEFEKALEVLEEAVALSSSDSHFLNCFDKVEIANRNFKFSKLITLVGQEKYEEAYQFYLEESYSFECFDLYYLMMFCEKKIGKLDVNKLDTSKYIVRQIVDYQEADFLEHVNKHLSDYNMDLECPNWSIFNFDFPISLVVEEIKKYMPSDKKLYTVFYADNYIFKYDRCGRCKDKSTNYFKVVVFHNTADLITMFPALNCENLPHIDLNYLVEEKEPKVKQLSQIEKFNLRYRR